MKKITCEAFQCELTPAYVAPRYRDGDPNEGIEWISLCADCVASRDSDFGGLEETRLPILPIPAEFFAKYAICCQID